MSGYYSGNALWSAEGEKEVVYEPSLEDGTTFFCSRVVNDLETFKEQSDSIMIFENL